MKKFTVRKYDLRKNRESGSEGTSLRFAFLTDLHSVKIGEDNRLLLSALEQAHPCAVLCGGDMIVGKPGQTPDTALRLMERLCRRWPVIHAMGNHEYRARIYPEVYGSLYDTYAEGLARCGAVLLDNRSCTLRFGKRKVTVYGLSIDREYYQRFRRESLPAEYLNRRLGRPDREGLSILLAHNPVYMKTYLEWGADVTLCGHYHGGVMRFGERRGLISPDFRLFPREAHGLFEKGGSRGIVGAGLGEHTIPLRVCNPRELVIFTV